MIEGREWKCSDCEQGPCWIESEGNEILDPGFCPWKGLGAKWSEPEVGE